MIVEVKKLPASKINQLDQQTKSLLNIHEYEFVLHFENYYHRYPLNSVQSLRVALSLNVFRHVTTTHAIDF